MRKRGKGLVDPFRSDKAELKDKKSIDLIKI